MKIFVIAPGFACSEKDLKQAKKNLESKGHEVVLPKGLIGKDLLCASAKENRITQIKMALKSDASVIWCLRGGYGSIELLESLKKMRKPSSKKIVWGYSDITALHSFFVNEWGWPVMHGPVLEALGQKNRITTSSLSSVWKYLNKKSQEFESGSLTPLNSEAKKSKLIISKLVGGNLSTLCSLLGTPYAWSLKNKILFIEEIGERSYKMDRKLNQLFLSGSLKGINALIFGEFTHSNEPDGKNLTPKVMKEWANKLKVPVLKGLKSGHGKHQPALPLNTKAQLKLGSKAKLKAKYEYS